LKLIKQAFMHALLVTNGRNFCKEEAWNLGKVKNESIGHRIA